MFSNKHFGISIFFLPRDVSTEIPTQNIKPSKTQNTKYITNSEILALKNEKANKNILFVFRILGIFGQTTTQIKCGVIKAL